MSVSYRVELRGVKDGCAKERVAEALGPLFKRSQEDVLALLEMPSVVIKRNVGLPVAQQYKQALEQRGCVCLLAREQAEAAGTTEDGMAALKAGRHEEAYAILKPLAEQGDALSQNGLAYLYKNGFGVAADQELAVQWFRKAAGQGLHKAQYNLGVYYFHDSVPQDHVEAYKWLSLAKEGGNEDAEAKLKSIEARLALDEIANLRQRARAWVQIGKSVGAGSAGVRELMKVAEKGNISVENLATIIPRIVRADAPLIASDEGKPEGKRTLVFSFGADLAVSFVFRRSSGDIPVTKEVFDLIGLSVDGLLSLAADNGYALVHPRFSVSQLTMEVQNGGGNVGKFFHYIETGEELEALCLFLNPIWGALRPLVKGELRIAIPNRSTCYFCGSEDGLSLAMMSDIARDTKAESGPNALSDVLFAIDEDGALRALDE